jgi:membrane-associated protein
VLVCVLAGYFFGNIALIKNHLGLATLVGLGLVIIAAILKVLVSKLQKSH